MKTLIIGKNEILLESEIKMKHLRKIMPLMGKLGDKQISELDLVVESAKIFLISINGKKDLQIFTEEMDNFSIKETMKFSEEVGEIIASAVNPEKKK